MRRYTCAACGGTFTAEWSTEEAEAEALEIFGIVDASRDPDMAEICDDCFKRLTAWLDAGGEG